MASIGVDQQTLQCMSRGVTGIGDRRGLLGLDQGSNTSYVQITHGRVVPHRHTWNHIGNRKTGKDPLPALDRKQHYDVRYRNPHLSEVNHFTWGKTWSLTLRLDPLSSFIFLNELKLLLIAESESY